MLDHLLDPFEIMSNTNINAWYIDLAATDAPRHDTDQLPNAIAFANQWTATISFARVFAFFAAGAQETRIQIVCVSQAGVTQLLLALLLANDWHIDLFENILVFAEIAKRILAPASGPTALARIIGEFIWQTSRTDVWIIGKIDRIVQCDHS